MIQFGGNISAGTSDRSNETLLKQFKEMENALSMAKKESQQYEVWNKDLIYPDHL